MRKCHLVLVLALVLFDGLFFANGCRDYPYTDQLYYLPYQEGHSSMCIQGNYGTGHMELDKCAIDFLMPVNSEIVASRSGVVVEVITSNPNINCPACPNNEIIIQHDDGTFTRYVHLNHDDTPEVQQGQYVEQGQFIAYSGNSGNSVMPHLHFESFYIDENNIRQYMRTRFLDIEGNGVPLVNNTYKSRNKRRTHAHYPDNDITPE